MPPRRKGTAAASSSESDQMSLEAYRAYDTSTSMVEVRAALKALDVKVPGSARSKVAHLEILHANLDKLNPRIASETENTDEDADEESIRKGRRKGSSRAKAADDDNTIAPAKSTRRSKRARSNDEQGGSEVDREDSPSKSERLSRTSSRRKRGRLSNAGVIEKDIISDRTPEPEESVASDVRRWNGDEMPVAKAKGSRTTRGSTRTQAQKKEEKDSTGATRRSRGAAKNWRVDTASTAEATSKLSSRRKVSSLEEEEEEEEEEEAEEPPRKVRAPVNGSPRQSSRSTRTRSTNRVVTTTQSSSQPAARNSRQAEETSQMMKEGMEEEEEEAEVEEEEDEEEKHAHTTRRRSPKHSPKKSPKGKSTFPDTKVVPEVVVLDEAPLQHPLSSSSSSKRTTHGTPMLDKLATVLSGDDKLSEDEYNDMLHLLQSVKDDAPNKSSEGAHTSVLAQEKDSTAPTVILGDGDLGKSKDSAEENKRGTRGESPTGRASLGGDWNSRESFLPSPTRNKSSKLVGMATLPAASTGIVSTVLSSGHPREVEGNERQSLGGALQPYDYGSTSKKPRTTVYDMAFSAPGKPEARRQSYGGALGAYYSGGKSASKPYTPTFKENAAKFYDAGISRTLSASQPISIVQRRRRLRMSESGTRSAQTAKKILETLSDLTNPIEEHRKEATRVSWSSGPRESLGDIGTSLGAHKPSEPPMSAPVRTVQPVPTPLEVSCTPKAPASMEFPFRAPDSAPSGVEAPFYPADAEIRFAFSSPSFTHTRAASAEAMRRLRISSSEIAKKGPIRSDGSDGAGAAPVAATHSSGASSFAVDGPDEKSQAAPSGEIKADPNSVWAQFMSKPKVFCPFCKVDNPPGATKCSCDNYLACPHCDKKNDACAEKTCASCGRDFEEKATRPTFPAFSPTLPASNPAPAPAFGSAPKATAGSIGPGGFSFGGAPAASAVSADLSAPAPAPAPAPAAGGVTFGSGGFSFGATASSAPAPAPATNKGPGVIFGTVDSAPTPAAEKSDKPAFGFGFSSTTPSAPAAAPVAAPVAAPTSAAAPAAAPSTTGFTFGMATKSSEEKDETKATTSSSNIIASEVGFTGFGNTTKAPVSDPSSAPAFGSGSVGSGFTFGTSTSAGPLDAVGSSKKRNKDDEEAGPEAKKPAAFGFSTGDATVKPAFTFGAGAASASSESKGGGPAPATAPATESNFSFGTSTTKPFGAAKKEESATNPLPKGADEASGDKPAFTFGAGAAKSSDKLADPGKSPGFGAGLATLSASALAASGLDKGGSTKGTGSDSPSSAMDMGYASGDNSNQSFGRASGASFPPALDATGSGTSTSAGAFAFGSSSTGVNNTSTSSSSGTFNFGAAGQSSSNTAFAFGASKSSNSSAPPFLGTAPGIAGAGVSMPGPAASLPPLGTGGPTAPSSGPFQFGGSSTTPAASMNGPGGASQGAPFTFGGVGGAPGPAGGVIPGGGAGFSLGTSDQAQGGRKRVKAKFKKK